MSDIPKAREILTELTNEIEAGELVNVVDCLLTIRKAVALMGREPAKRKTRVKSDAMTAAKRDEIKRLLAYFPRKSNQEIAVMASVNAGRVSETNHGKWDYLR